MLEPTNYETDYSGCIMDYHASTWGLGPDWDGIKTKLHVLRKEQ